MVCMAVDGTNLPLTAVVKPKALRYVQVCDGGKPPVAYTNKIYMICVATHDDVIMTS